MEVEEMEVDRMMEDSLLLDSFLAEPPPSPLLTPQALHLQPSPLQTRFLPPLALQPQI